MSLYILSHTLCTLADSESNNNGREYSYVNNKLYIRCHIVVLHINM
jgi:hypothetical protein